MEPVRPDTGAYEFPLGADQPEFQSLRAAVYRHPGYGGAVCVVTRWTFSDEEREAVARGEDMWVQSLTGGGAFQPLYLQVGADGYICPPPAAPGDPRWTTCLCSHASDVHHRVEGTPFQPCGMCECREFVAAPPVGMDGWRPEAP